MKKLVLTSLFALFMIPLLNGCATAVVGGAAVGASAIHDRRSAGAVLDDQSIELKAVIRLFQNKLVSSNTHINVTSYNGRVLMTGEAPSQSLKDRAANLIRTIPKVREIHNEIILAAPSAVIARSSDSYVTSKVKISLLNIQNIRGFDPTRVKVVTENGTAYLMGLLWQAEVQPVVETVRRVGGVQRVVKLFEKID